MATIIKLNDIKMDVPKLNNILLTRNGTNFASSSMLIVLLLRQLLEKVYILNIGKTFYN